MKKLKTIALCLLCVIVAVCFTACDDPVVVDKVIEDARYTPQTQETVTDYEYKYNFWTGDFVLVPNVHTETVPEKMDINIKTKFSIGDTVYFVKESTSYYEIPCTHCGGNYREIVNNIEYKCPYCTGGREKQKIKHYEVESGIVTNIRIALYGEREVVDRITHNHIRTNVLYSVTPHNAVDDYYDTDANSISKYEGELYATRADADATVESVKTVTTIDENGRQIK